MSRFLDDFSALLSTRKHHIHRIAEIKDNGNAEILELNPATPCQNGYSIAKAFTVTAVGFLSDRGLLGVEENVPAALGKFCPAEYNPRWNTTTIHMLMKHLVGLPTGFLDIDCEDANMFGADYLHYAMNYPLYEDHGTVYRYTDAAFYLLSCIVENRAGMPLDNFLWRELFLPLQFRDAAWSHCPLGHTMGATGLFLRAEDMVKLGVLYLNGGMWNGKRLLSEAWVNTVFERGYELTTKESGKAYGKGGMLGQNLLIIPRARRAVAWHAASGLGQEDLTSFICNYPD